MTDWLMEGSNSMTAQTKGRIRHIALSVEDPWETAEFYKQAMGLEEVIELDGELAEGVFLTDGVVNLAILAGHRQGLGRHPPYRLLGR
jgi:catechol-2,3-dioxygenase